MAFSREEILDDFDEAACVGRMPQRSLAEALEAERSRLLAASRERFAQWIAIPENRERRRRRMKEYNARTDTKARQARRMRGRKR